MVVLLGWIKFLDAFNLYHRTVLTKDYLTSLQHSQAHNKFLNRDLAILLVTKYPSKMVFEYLRLLLHEHSVPQKPDKRFFEKFNPLFCTVFTKCVQ